MENECVVKLSSLETVKGVGKGEAQYIWGALNFPTIHQNPLWWDMAALTTVSLSFFVSSVLFACHSPCLFCVKLNSISNTLGSRFSPRWMCLILQCLLSGFLLRIEIQVFTIWGSFVILEFFPGRFSGLTGDTFVNKIKIFVYVPRVLHLLDLVTEGVYFIVEGEWCHWDCIVGKCKTIKWGIYKSTLFWCIGVKQRIIIGMVVK